MVEYGISQRTHQNVVIGKEAKATTVRMFHMSFTVLTISACEYSHRSNEMSVNCLYRTTSAVYDHYVQYVQYLSPRRVAIVNELGPVASRALYLPWLLRGIVPAHLALLLVLFTPEAQEPSNLDGNVTLLSRVPLLLRGRTATQETGGWYSRLQSRGDDALMRW